MAGIRNGSIAFDLKVACRKCKAEIGILTAETIANGDPVEIEEAAPTAALLAHRCAT